MHANRNLMVGGIIKFQTLIKPGTKTENNIWVCSEDAKTETIEHIKTELL